MILKYFGAFSLILFSKCTIHAQEPLRAEDDLINSEAMIAPSSNDTFPASQSLDDSITNSITNDAKPKIVKNQQTQGAMSNSDQRLFSKLQYSYDQIPPPFKVISEQPLSFTKIIKTAASTPMQIVQSLIENFITLQLKWLQALGRVLIPQRMPQIMQKVNSATNNGNANPNSILDANNIIPLIPPLDFSQLTQALSMPDTITQNLNIPGMPFQIPFISQTQKPNPSQNQPVNAQPTNSYQTPNYQNLNSYQSPQNYPTPTNYQTSPNYKLPNYQNQNYDQQSIPYKNQDEYNPNYLTDPSAFTTIYETPTYSSSNYPQNSPAQSSAFSTRPDFQNYQGPSRYSQTNNPYNQDYANLPTRYPTQNSHSSSSPQYVYSTQTTPLYQDPLTQAATPNYSNLQTQQSGYSNPTVTPNYQDPSTQTTTPNYSILPIQQTDYPTSTVTPNYQDPPSQLTSSTQTAATPNYSNPPIQKSGYSSSTVTSNYQDPPSQLTSSTQTAATPNYSNPPIQKSSYSSSTVTSNYPTPIATTNTQNYSSSRTSTPKSSASAPQTTTQRPQAASRLPSPTQRPGRTGAGFFGGIGNGINGLSNGISGIGSGLTNGISGLSNGITNGLGNVNPFKART